MDTLMMVVLTAYGALVLYQFVVLGTVVRVQKIQSDRLNAHFERMDMHSKAIKALSVREVRSERLQ